MNAEERTQVLRLLSKRDLMLDLLKEGVAFEIGVSDAEYWDLEHEQVAALQRKIAELEESLHYANGVAELAMKHRDAAEARVLELEEGREDLEGLFREWSERN